MTPIELLRARVQKRIDGKVWTIGDVTELENALPELLAELERRLQETESLKQQLATALEDTDKLRAENNNLTKELDAMNDNFGFALEEVKRLRAENSALQKELQKERLDHLSTLGQFQEAKAVECSTCDGTGAEWNEGLLGYFNCCRCAGTGRVKP